MSVRMAGGGANDEEIDSQLREDEESPGRRGRMELFENPKQPAATLSSLPDWTPELSLRLNSNGWHTT